MNKTNLAKTRKSQVKMLETVSVLIIIFVIMAVALIFYASQQRASLENTRQERQSMNAMELSQVIKYSPFFQCSNNGVVVDNCFDLPKIKAMQQLMTNQNIKNNYFYELFRYSTVTIEQIYPTSTNPALAIYTIYDKQKSSAGFKAYYAPILIHNPEEGSQNYAFGVLVVKVYE